MQLVMLRKYYFEPNFDNEELDDNSEMMFVETEKAVQILQKGISDASDLKSNNEDNNVYFRRDGITQRNKRPPTSQ